MAVVVLVAGWWLCANILGMRAQSPLFRCGDVVADTTWNASSVHVITCDMKIPANVKLTVAAGAVIKFEAGTKLTVEGTLQAVGTKAAPIYFTSIHDDSIGGDTDGTDTAPAMGDWDNIQFSADSNDASTISRAVIRYSGNSTIGVTAGAILLVDASPTLSYITFENNYLNGAKLYSFNDWSSDTWDNTTVIHVLEETFALPENRTLAIEPGAVIKLGELVSMKIDGRLLAEGTVAQPITFTSLADDSACGVGAADEPICDTYGDGDSSTPSRGDWGAIQFGASSDDASSISRAVIRYSGRVSGSSVDDGAIELDNASPQLAHITFTDNYINGAAIRSGIDWSTSAWDSDTVVYVLKSLNLTVPTGETLSVAAGATVKLGNSVSLKINGDLQAVGTVDAPVHFTSLWDDTLCGTGAADEPICDTVYAEEATVPATGDWGNIQFGADSGALSAVSRAVIRYSGSAAGNNVDDGAIWLNNASPELSHITFENNYLNGAELMGGTEWRDATLTSTTVSYVLEEGDITVPEDGMFALKPGVTLKLADDNSLLVAGELNATGTVDAPILFTSLHDDGACGSGAAGEAVCDTNNNADATAPATGDWGYIRFDSGSDASVLERAEVRYSGSNLSVDVNDGAIFLSNASPTLAHISFVENYINGVELDGQISWGTDTWDNTTLVYVLEEGDITVPFSNTLTIAPDMRIKLGNRSSLNIAGRLVAAGTADQPIYFVSAYDTTVCGIGAANEAVCNTHSGAESNVPAPGDWGNITFEAGSSANSLLSRVVLRHSGNALNNADNSAILLDGVLPGLSYLTLAQNETNGATLNSKANWNGQTLQSGTVVYVVEGTDLVVPAAGSLNVARDVRVKLGVGSDIVVNGTLTVAGAAEYPVYFTALTDDAACGTGAAGEPICDTDANGLTTPQPGDWGQLRFGSGSDDSTLAHAILRYGGSDNGLGVNDAALLLEGVAPTVAHSAFTNNYRGIEVRNASPSLICNDIYGNNDYGLYNATADHTVLAEEHWWGNGSGPMHSANPGGTGDTVSDGVSYAPWASSACITQIYTDTHLGQTGADLAVAFDGLPSTEESGSIVEFTVVITNHGTSIASGVSLDLTLPAALLPAAEFSGANCTKNADAGDSVVCAIGALDQGENTSVTVAVRVDQDAPASWTHTATVGGDQPDEVPENNTAAQTVRIAGSDDPGRGETGGTGIFLPIVVR